MAKRIRQVCLAAAVLPLALLAACSTFDGANPSALPPTSPSVAANLSTGSTTVSETGSTTVSETGSTLLLPLISTWQVAYGTLNPKVLVTTSGTGSGVGIADAAAGTVDIGGSDAYLSPTDISQHPGLENIPVAVAALMVNYNVPGVGRPLRLSGKVLARIYTGKITVWNDPAIEALNPGAPLPSLRIVPLHRADSSGSTFLFTSYLTAQDPAGWPASNVDTTVNWPGVPGAQAETGSGSMVKGCAAIKGCIAYIGVSYLSQTSADRLGEAALANKSGRFTRPTAATIRAALGTFSSATPPSGTQSLINGPAGYPVINYEYAVVRMSQRSATTAAAIKGFLLWGITAGNAFKYLAAVNFTPLPGNVQTIAKKLIDKITAK